MKRRLKQSVPHRQRGISLVELMVASTLGLIIIAGAGQIFLSSKQSYAMQDALARLQENARFSVMTLTRDSRIADFWGCHGNLANISSDLKPTGTGYIDFTGGGISGTDGGGSNDTLIIQGAYATGIHVETPYMPTPAANLQATANANLKAGDILLVSDCVSGDIFQATNVGPNGAKTQIVHNTGVPAIMPGNLSGNLSKIYQGDAQIYKVRQIVYSIQNGADGNPSLFRSDNGNDQELISGVESFQVLYGEDSDGDGSANRYVDASAAGLNMSKVISLRITLTLRTQSTNLTSSADGRIRHSYTATITIRNRVT